MIDYSEQDNFEQPEQCEALIASNNGFNCANGRYLSINDMSEGADYTYWGDETDDAGLFKRSNKPMYSAAHWSVAWSDLMMTMFILFLVMYAYKTSGHDFLSQSNSGSPAVIRAAGNPPVPGGLGNGQGGGAQLRVTQSFSRLYDFSKLVIKQNDLMHFAAIDLTPDKTMKIVLTGDILFDPGQATLRPAAKASLEKIAGLLTYIPYNINVVGHTDSVPVNSAKFPSNWELSAARAGTVARFLITDTHLPPSQFEISGRADCLPVADNDTAANRALNRRVEIIISKAGNPAKVFAGNFPDIKSQI